VGGLFSGFGSKIMLEKLEYEKPAAILLHGRAGHLTYFHIFCLCAAKLYFARFLSIYAYEIRGKVDVM